jgi:CPA1 family monovalent cation:H+ antiporter
VAFIANALLFLLVGAELNPTRFLFSASSLPLLITAVLAVVAVLLSRLIVVLMLPSLTQPLIPQTVWSFVPPTWRLAIFWSGLRGALSLALVLALPLNVPFHGTLVASTYAVVFFTLLVQGFSLRLVLQRLPSLAE